jgi:predicted enzyme related to lactoylglutathione lyase
MANRTAVALALVFATATGLAAQSTSDKPTASGTPKDEPETVPAQEVHVKRVTGIGGVFFHAKDPKALRAWYKEHLGIDVQDWGGAAFEWVDSAGNPTRGTTAWLIDAAGNEHFAPSTAQFMINYRVEDLDALLQLLRAEGCNVLEKTDDSEYGKFGWVMDPEGNKVELWQPPEGQ